MVVVSVAGNDDEGAIVVEALTGSTKRRRMDAIVDALLARAWMTHLDVNLVVRVAPGLPHALITLIAFTGRAT